MDAKWAIAELQRFVDLTERDHYLSNTQMGTLPVSRFRGETPEIQQQAEVVEQILDRVNPDWISSTRRTPTEWAQHREACQRAMARLKRRAEIEEKLGDSAPRMTASGFHPWVWEPAKAMWKNGHYRAAIQQAATMVSLETQKLTNDTSRSETDLFRYYLGRADATVDHPRLRRAGDDGSTTALSVRDGMLQFAAGLYMGLRNPASHAVDEIDENEALEQLAAFSLLARFVSECKLVTS
ncbi:restriction endonuclease [Rhodococcus hoagii]|nr:restriction endonuclease [Prescottella equi]